MFKRNKYYIFIYLLPTFFYLYLIYHFTELNKPASVLNKTVRIRIMKKHKYVQIDRSI